MLLLLGLNAANSHYACIWCEIHAHNRWDTSVDASKYNGENMRKLADIKRKASLRPSQKNADSKKGCTEQPLLEIEPSDCVVDELHLFLRITDVLFQSFFSKMVALDHAHKVHKTGSGDHVSRAAQYITELGVPFKVWVKEDSSKTVEMTTLNRNRRLKVISGLPTSFDKLLPEELSSRLAQLWLVSPVCSFSIALLLVFGRIFILCMS